MNSNSYAPTIGIECHVQLKTKTKLFAAVANDAREAPPNSLVSHICFGMPGALPVLNEHAITLAIRAAFALKTRPESFSKFDRKHYFYPDLPKGYQISQFNHPIIAGGEVDITVGGETKTIGVTRAHLEEDAGKSTHPAGKDYSLVDLNRAGTPLLEIVSEPEIHSAVEAKAYARELYLLMKYAEVTDGDLYHGHMRFDVNVSVSKDPKAFGTRTETKNLNSFRSVEKAVEYEIKRQTEVLEKGGEITQETRGWDDAKQKTFTQRTKEEAHDYRYFPDPDIPPVVLSNSDLEHVKEETYLSPNQIRELLKELKLETKFIENTINNPKQTLAIIRIKKAYGNNHARRIAIWYSHLASSWFIESLGVAEGEQSQMLSRDFQDRVEVVTAEIDKQLVSLSEMVESNRLSSTAATEILKEMINTKEYPKVIAERKNLLQVSDEGEITKIVEQVLKDNSQAAEDVKKGEMKAIGFLVGQVMKESKGQANPSLAQELIKKQLGA